MARWAPVGWNRAPPCQKEGSTATRIREIAAYLRPKALDASQRRPRDGRIMKAIIGGGERGHRHPAAGLTRPDDRSRRSSPAGPRTAHLLRRAGSPPNRI